MTVRQRYRSHDDSHWASISVVPGAVIITMEFETLAEHTRLHAHAFDHWMECKNGAAIIELDGKPYEIREGQKYFVEAHKQHGVWPLIPGTVLECRHEHEDIHPDKIDGDGIPIEWLARLTDKEPA